MKNGPYVQVMSLSLIELVDSGLHFRNSPQQRSTGTLALSVQCRHVPYSFYRKSQSPRCNWNLVNRLQKEEVTAASRPCRPTPDRRSRAMENCVFVTLCIVLVAVFGGNSFVNGGKTYCVLIRTVRRRCRGVNYVN